MIPQTTINIIQIGVGGTGSWLVPLCVKLFSNIVEAVSDKNIKYILIDNDIVEPINIKRQNFESEDINKNKAIATLRKYNHIFNGLFPMKIEINKKELQKVFKKKLINNTNSINIIVGCVDNNTCRREIFEFMKRRKEKIIYIDSGNNLYDGQILTLIRNITKDDLTNFAKRKIDFLEKFKEIPNNPEYTEPTCELFGNQSLQINNLAASLLYTNIHNIIVDGRLPSEEIVFSNYGYCTFEI